MKSSTYNIFLIFHPGVSPNKWMVQCAKLQKLLTFRQQYLLCLQHILQKTETETSSRGGRVIKSDFPQIIFSS